MATLIDIPANVSGHLASIAGLLAFIVAGAFWSSVFSKLRYQCEDEVGSAVIAESIDGSAAHE